MFDLSKGIGLPIDRLICASNENKVLYDFLNTGAYDRNREFILTSSPSMDILISSNLERLIFRIAGEDAGKTRELMDGLSADGRYEITEAMKEELSCFYGDFASEQETKEGIRKLYEKTGYIMDTHTAVARQVYEKYKKQTGDQTKTVIASTASPYKFTRSVMTAIDQAFDRQDDFALVDELNKLSKVPVPAAIEEIRTALELHKKTCAVEQMEQVVKDFLR